MTGKAANLAWCNTPSDWLGWADGCVLLRVALPRLLLSTTALVQPCKGCTRGHPCHPDTEVGIFPHNKQNREPIQNFRV